MNSSMISQSHCSGNSSFTGPSESGKSVISRVEEITGMIPTQKVVEKLAAILVRVETIVDVGLETGVDMAIIQFAIQDQKYGIYDVSLE